MRSCSPSVVRLSTPPFSKITLPRLGVSMPEMRVEQRALAARLAEQADELAGVELRGPSASSTVRLRPSL